MTQSIYHAAGIVAFLSVILFCNPKNAANWFHTFQSHLFELQMEQLK